MESNRQVEANHAGSPIPVETLRANCREFGIKLDDMNDIRQGIVHRPRLTGKAGVHCD